MRLLSMEASPTTAGLMPPPAAKLLSRQDLDLQEHFLDQPCLDKPQATSNLLKKSESAARMRVIRLALLPLK